MASRRPPDPKSPMKPAATPQPVTSSSITPGDASASRDATTPPPPSKKSAEPRVKREPASRPRISPDARRGMIAEAAYLRAERRGFTPGGEEEDWLAAEAEVDKLLSADQRAPQ